MKVFLGVSDNNYNFINKFLELFDNSYDLTIGLFENRYECPVHDKIINLNFNNLTYFDKYDKVSFFEMIIKGFDLVVSNNILNLSRAAKSLNIKYIQYSDLFLYEELFHNKEVLFGSLLKTNLRRYVLNIAEIEVYKSASSNWIYNPLVFFHNFNAKSYNILQPYFKYGTTGTEIDELSISHSANKTIINDCLNISNIEDFGYMKLDFNSKNYYDMIASSAKINLDIDYQLMTDCLFNNIRPNIHLINKSLNNFYLYNYSRVLNLSNVVEKIPYSKQKDETEYPTLNDIILEQL